jgi:dipeptidase D
MVKTYREMFGAEPQVVAIHAGLECGLFAGNLPGLSAISLGCNIKDLHTPAERMELSSYERIYRTLLTFLKKD